MWGGFESRKFPRVKTDCSIFIKQVNGGRVISAATENIGTGGICVILNEPLQKFSKIKMELNLTDGEMPISCDGRVAWIVPSRDFLTEKLTHDTGIEFVNLPEPARGRIERAVKLGRGSHQ